MSDPSWILSGDLRVVWEKIIGIFSKSYGIFSANSPFDSFSLLYKGKPFKQKYHVFTNIAVWSSEQPLFFYHLISPQVYSHVPQPAKHPGSDESFAWMMGLISFFPNWSTAVINLWISWLKEDYFDNWLIVSFFKPSCSVFVGSSFLNMRICCFLWPLW